ncbi:NAD(P)-binding protein [Aspergillus uvarum CBS 121591]|uniref:NAD(P)-binding protein n=1 Tax=Aspergillus uvarum CBS 121591 TaxID=1448315 RepID=A0A319CLS6_9EURO|nr:NAD(P)-binding protein [Aspergillus uvarum CBS 121591]PYH85490.1 NAD(P)-binding protein [Aspergillus uvarum CBS 121591]
METTGYALVVGGGSGIGKACALLFAKEGAAGVIVADLDVSAAETVGAQCVPVASNPKFRAEAIQVDITKEDSVKRAVDKAVQAFGRIDYCVNCAGIGVQQGTDIVSLSLADIKRFIEVNTIGTFLVTREVSAVMRSQEPVTNSSSSATNRGETRGAIVNLGSASSKVAAPGVLPYTASKHAVLGLSKNAALDNVDHGIRVNCVCPSWVDTPMVQEAVAGVDGLADFIKAAVPMGRIAHPEEVADAVIFLCSPRSSYITGSDLIVDGGTTLTASR